jgi:hypothetical protein
MVAAQHARGLASVLARPEAHLRAALGTFDHLPT